MELKCCICGTEFVGYGNNAEPIRKGVCCDRCNERYILTSRILSWSGAFEIARTHQEEKNLDKRLAEKNFEQMSISPNKLMKRYENIETQENVIVLLVL